MVKSRKITFMPFKMVPAARLIKCRLRKAYKSCGGGYKCDKIFTPYVVVRIKKKNKVFSLLQEYY